MAEMSTSRPCLSQVYKNMTFHTPAEASYMHELVREATAASPLELDSRPFSGSLGSESPVKDTKSILKVVGFLGLMAVFVRVFRIGFRGMLSKVSAASESSRAASHGRGPTTFARTARVRGGSS